MEFYLLAVAILVARGGDHLGRGIDPEDGGAGLGDAGGEVAAAAADVEYPFAGFRFQHIDQVFTEAGDETQPAVVERGVPTGSHHFLPVSLLVEGNHIRR